MIFVRNMDLRLFSNYRLPALNPPYDLQRSVARFVRYAPGESFFALAKKRDFPRQVVDDDEIDEHNSK